jgi:hypothetical protein
VKESWGEGRRTTTGFTRTRVAGLGSDRPPSQMQAWTNISPARIQTPVILNLKASKRLSLEVCKQVLEACELWQRGLRSLAAGSEFWCPLEQMRTTVARMTVVMDSVTSSSVGRADRDGRADWFTYFVAPL